MMTTIEAARHLAVTPGTLYRLMDGRRLSVYRQGSRIVLDRAEVERYDGLGGESNDREPRIAPRPDLSGACVIDPLGR